MLDAASPPEGAYLRRILGGLPARAGEVAIPPEEVYRLKGVILAAGKGTRMLPLTERRPKPLVPVLDRPMIEHIITGARDAGVDHIALVVGYLGQMIREAYGDGSKLGVRLEYIWQEVPRGTGAGTLLAADFVGDEPFFLSWGDIMVAPETYTNVVRVWVEEQPEAILSLNWVEDPWEGAAVYVDDGGYIERILEKPPQGTSTTHYNNAGIFLLRPEIMEILRGVGESERGEVEFPDAVQALLRQGQRIRGLEVIGYWSDVARPSTLLELNGAMIRHRSADGIMVSDKARVSSQCRLVPPVYIGAGCQVGRADLGPGVTLGPDTVVADGAQLDNVVTFGANRIGAGSVLRHAILEERADVGAGEQVIAPADTPQVVTRH